MLGVCIDVPTHFIKYLNLEELSILIRLIVILFAQACFGLSFAWMQTFENGMNPMDAIFFRIIKKFHCKYMTIRIIYDGIYLIILSITTNGFFTEKAKQVIELLQDGGLKIWMKKQFSQQ